MILFIAPNPHKIKEHEGYLQRVAAIDKIFAKHTKKYSQDYESNLELAEAINRADIIYVHSIYRAEEIIDCYPVFGHKIITDLHGVVPEEESMLGEHRRSKELEDVQDKVFAFGRAFIAVTEAMREYYSKKYTERKDEIEWITLPIFDNQVVERNGEHLNVVVYAGGSQKWQNVDLMIEAINTNKFAYDYDILTHDIKAFESIKTTNRKISIQSVLPKDVKDHYMRASLGFILRDDNIVNRVACPTKLIEYLCYGIVPIVKSSNIGDFEKLGYKYIQIEDFNIRKITKSEIKEYAHHNYEIIKILLNKTENSKKALLKIVDKIFTSSNDYRIDDILLLASAIENSRKTKELNAANYQISEQIKMIDEYASAMNYYRDQLESNKYIKLSNKVRNYKNHLRRLIHR